MPDRVETHIGPLEFKDGAPTLETIEKVRDTLDFTCALKCTTTASAARPEARHMSTNEVSPQMGMLLAPLFPTCQLGA
jgi:hypothetical protein